MRARARIAASVVALGFLAAIAVGIVRQIGTARPTQASQADIAWAVDPHVPGPDAPPQGRSLFDFLVGIDDAGRAQVPFPFSALVARIERELAAPAGVKRVLIPMGRSLQRSAATPEFFKFPRAVLAVDGEPAVHARMLLKDRLYFGYQEKANIVEVISYNEAAGRFEFQLVKDYRKDGARTVSYANRALCTTCHQGAGPIFSRPLWDETNANVLIAQRLAQESRDYYGFPVEPVSDHAYAIDNAGDRANLYSAYQRVWQQACTSTPTTKESDTETLRCRADLLRAALQYRLTGMRGFEAASARYRQHLARLRSNWQRHWPHGLAIPDNDIPNRNPFLNVATGALSAQPLPAFNALTLERGGDISLDIPAQLEPLQLRAPGQVWSAARDEDLMRAVGGIAEFLSERDIDAVDAALAAHVTAVQWQSLACEASAARGRALDVQCGHAGGPRFSAHLTAGDGVDAITWAWPDGARWTQIEARDVRVTRRGAYTQVQFQLRDVASARSLRNSDGNALVSLALEWEREASVRPRLTLTVATDSARIDKAMEKLIVATHRGSSDVLTAQPFRRAAAMPAVLRALGASVPHDTCCLDATRLPPLRVDPPAKPPVANEDIKLFQHHCARCHDTPETFPPNFMHGDPAQVDTQIAQCADRILFRLSMWEQAASARAKTPMPPAHALAATHITETQWIGHSERARLKRFVAARASVAAPTLLQRPYEDLRACLAATEKDHAKGGHP